MTAMHEPSCVLITGASGGLGSALARGYARPGRQLLLHGRDLARLDDVAQDCRQAGATTTLLLCDLRDAHTAADRIRDLAEVHPPDLAIVNAGVTCMQTSPSAIMDLQATERVLQVNLLGATATVAGVLPSMVRRGRGQIALVSSLAAYRGTALTPAYSASKAGLLAYGQGLRPALAPHGISVSVVLPGFLETPMTRGHAGPAISLLSTSAAAHRIMQGLARGRAQIAFPLHLAIGLRLLGLLPSGTAEAILALAGHGPGSTRP